MYGQRDIQVAKWASCHMILLTPTKVLEIWISHLAEVAVLGNLLLQFDAHYPIRMGIIFDATNHTIPSLSVLFGSPLHRLSASAGYAATRRGHNATTSLSHVMQCR